MPINATLVETDLLPLGDGEMALIYMLRTKYRWGKVEIEVADGVPTFISRTVERDKLGGVKLSTPAPLTQST